MVKLAGLVFWLIAYVHAQMLEDIFTIMADGEDDKEGRIRDYIRVHAEHYADWKIENDRLYS